MCNGVLHLPINEQRHAMAFLGSKEFYEVMDQFERDYKEHGFTRMDREKDKEYWKRSIYYENAETNLAFKWYLAGYQASKSVHVQ